MPGHEDVQLPECRLLTKTNLDLVKSVHNCHPEAAKSSSTFHRLPNRLNTGFAAYNVVRWLEDPGDLLIARLAGLSAPTRTCTRTEVETSKDWVFAFDSNAASQRVGPSPESDADGSASRDSTRTSLADDGKSEHEGSFPCLDGTVSTVSVSDGPRTVSGRALQRRQVFELSMEQQDTDAPILPSYEADENAITIAPRVGTGEDCEDHDDDRESSQIGDSPEISAAVLPSASIGSDGRRQDTSSTQDRGVESLSTALSNDQRDSMVEQRGTHKRREDRITSQDQDDVAINSSRQTIVDVLMQEVHHMLGIYEVATKTSSSHQVDRVAIGAYNSDAAAPCSQAISTQQQGSNKRRRGRATDQDDDEEDENEDIRQKPKVATEPLLRLACPFFKKDPSTYRSWQVCGGPGFEGSHRVKEHLYRRHLLPPICPRCGEDILSEEELITHLQAPIPCAVRETTPREGVTKVQEAKLRKRKGRNQPDIDVWREIWRILFPHDIEETIPSPFYEDQPSASGVPPSASAAQARQDVNSDLDRIQAIVHDGTLRRVRQQLDDTSVQIQPGNVNAGGTSWLVEIVRDAQDDAFREFRAAHQQSSCSVAADSSENDCPPANTNIETPAGPSALSQRRVSPSSDLGTGLTALSEAEVDELHVSSAFDLPHIDAEVQFNHYYSASYSPDATIDPAELLISPSSPRTETEQYTNLDQTLATFEPTAIDDAGIDFMEADLQLRNEGWKPLVHMENPGGPENGSAGDHNILERLQTEPSFSEFAHI